MTAQKCNIGFLLCLVLAFVACNQQPTITSYEQCVEAGYPMMKTYPPQCRDGQNLFVQDLGNTQEKIDLIRITSPSPGRRVSQPLTITGEARGYWFFEANFPVVLRVEGTNEEFVTYAQAQDDWMTEDFVPFTAEIFSDLPTSGRGTLFLRKANASGLPEHDDALRVPIRF